MKLTGINQLWVADITDIRLKAEFVYLAVILDRICAAISPSPDSSILLGKADVSRGDFSRDARIVAASNSTAPPTHVWNSS